MDKISMLRYSNLEIFLGLISIETNKVYTKMLKTFVQAILYGRLVKIVNKLSGHLFTQFSHLNDIKFTLSLLCP